MTKERLKSPRARLFVALDLPERVREGLVAWQRGALTDPALRPAAAEALHVTLCFLAYQPEREIERIAEVVQGVESRPIEIRFDAEPAPVPPNRPRLFAVDAESEGTVVHPDGRIQRVRQAIGQPGEVKPIREQLLELEGALSDSAPGKAGEPQLFDDLVELTRLEAGAQLLEIGCATGKATRSLLERGFSVVCVELGAQLAERARRNLAGFPLDIHVAPFETWEAPPEAFDLVYAATA